MDAVLDFRLLGPVSAVRDGEALPIAGGKRRALLAALLLDANRVVPTDRLITRLWGEDSPGNARNSLQNHVLRLRRDLADENGRSPIVTRPDGYLIEVPPGALDLDRFSARVRQAEARASDGENEAAVDLYRSALAEWRGEPLAGIDSEPLRRQFEPLLAERRLAALSDRVAIELASGRHQEVLGELAELTTIHPLHEPFWTQRMLALYRCGRAAEALGAYDQAAGRLAEELGIDPGPALRQMRQSVLTDAPALALPQARPAGSADAAAPQAATESSAHARHAPRSLPADTAAFTGRSVETARLVELAQAAVEGGSTGPVVISAIDGMAGVGKTALALHVAHHVAELFPDGQLFADLRGFAKDNRPRSPHGVLEGFLRALGVPAEQFGSDDVDDLAAVYRDRLSGTRTLIVLDNAASEAQIRPLLPGSPGCLVLVTTRKRLRALDEARVLALDVLPTPDATALLIAVAGPGRVDPADPRLDEVAVLCGHLPLALRIAASLLRARPSWSLDHLIGLLRDQLGRISRLQDAERGLEGLFDLSYARLDAAARRMFGLAGLVPGPRFGTRGAAALADVPPSEADRLLQLLVDHNLLAEPEPGRYQLHDLVRLYAADRAREEFSDEERAQALARLTDYYVHTALAGDKVLFPNRKQLGTPELTPGARPESPTGEEAVLAWFEAEHTGMLAVQKLAAEQGRDEAVWWIAWTTATYHQWSGNGHDMLATWRLALASADRLGDPERRLAASRLTGRAYTIAGRPAEAVVHLRRALALAEEAGDDHAQANTHYVLMLTYDEAGQDESALEHAFAARDLYRKLGDTSREVDMLNAVGWYAARRKEYELARKNCEAALELCRSIGYAKGEGPILDSLGYIAHETGDYPGAVGYYEEAIAIHRDRHAAPALAEVLEHLGESLAALGTPEAAEAAEAAWREALELHEDQGRSDKAERLRALLAGSVS